MNLKESFRYQNFLSSMISGASASLVTQSHCLTTTKNHLRSKVNADASDVRETVDVGEFPANDSVLDFMLFLIGEREKLTTAIGTAKASIKFDLDAAVETNKSRQQVCRSIGMMLRSKASKRIEKGTDYKFNAEGNQMAYYYDVEVVSAEAFDRNKAKGVMHTLTAKADEISAAIDSAMINTRVDYEPPFNVNDSFEDVIAEFLAQNAK